MRTHPGAKGTPDTLALITYSSGTIAFSVKMIAHLNDLLRTSINTKLATFTAVFIKNDLSQTVFPLSMVELTFQN